MRIELRHTPIIPNTSRFVIFLSPRTHEFCSLCLFRLQIDPFVNKKARQMTYFSATEKRSAIEGQGTTEAGAHNCGYKTTPRYVFGVRRGYRSLDNSARMPSNFSRVTVSCKVQGLSSRLFSAEQSQQAIAGMS
jgi:hypothetical protein